MKITTRILHPKMVQQLLIESRPIIHLTLLLLEDENDWVPNEEHQKLLFHYGQLEQQLQRSVAKVSALTDEKQKLEHLVLQLQSETETIGEKLT